MRGTGDAQTFSNISATTAAFALDGGLYELAAVATWGGGNVQLQQLGPDGSTWLNVGTDLTANGVTTMDCPPGTYQLAVTTATGVTASICRVPTD